eukprot:1178929-Prorocentrum_minimum.AAC.2
MRGRRGQSRRVHVTRRDLRSSELMPRVRSKEGCTWITCRVAFVAMMRTLFERRTEHRLPTAHLSGHEEIALELADAVLRPGERASHLGHLIVQPCASGGHKLLLQILRRQRGCGGASEATGGGQRQRPLCLHPEHGGDGVTQMSRPAPHRAPGA